jgi:hypothetical protein
MAGVGRWLPAVRESHQPISAAGQPTSGAYAVPAGDEWSRWWDYARRSARLFAAAVEPPRIEVYGPVLDADESGLVEAEAFYSRCYGGDGRYNKSDLLVSGRPAVMVGALAVNAGINHHRKVAARREAEVRWRDQQRMGVIATTHRLLCNTDLGWESYWYGLVTEFYPDLEHWSITLGFERCAPLRLAGAAAPALCLWTATAVLGDRWVSDPRLSRLLH